MALLQHKEPGIRFKIVRCKECDMWQVQRDLPRCGQTAGRPKVSHPTERAAMQEITRLSDAGNTRKLYSYRCSKGGRKHWHIGSKRGKVKRDVRIEKTFRDYEEIKIGKLGCTLTILGATYGSSAETRVDVTSKVQCLVKDGTFLFVSGGIHTAIGDSE